MFFLERRRGREGDGEGAVRLWGERVPVVVVLMEGRGGVRLILRCSTSRSLRCFAGLGGGWWGVALALGQRLLWVISSGGCCRRLLVGAVWGSSGACGGLVGCRAVGGGWLGPGGWGWVGLGFVMGVGSASAGWS